MNTDRVMFDIVNDVVKLFNKKVDSEDKLFLDRAVDVLNAVEAVFAEYPAADLPYDGDVEKSCKVCVLMYFDVCPHVYYACVLTQHNMCPHDVMFSAFPSNS